MSTNVKKIYQPLIQLLNDNSNKKVSTLLPQILELVQSKQMNKTFQTDENDVVTHVFCYYHKKWEPVTDVEYGSKKNTSHGLNTMCKEGVSNWSKQQRDFKKGKESLLDQVSKGTLAPSEVEGELEKLEEMRNEIVPREDGIGYDEIPTE